MSERHGKLSELATLNFITLKSRLGGSWLGPDEEPIVKPDGTVVRKIGLIRVNKEYAEKITDKRLTIPGVIIIYKPYKRARKEEDNTPQPMLIDGWHRLWKLRRLCMEEMPVYVLNEKIVKKFKIVER